MAGGIYLALETGPKTAMDTASHLETWNKLNITLAIRNWALINVFNTICRALEGVKSASCYSCNFHTSSESSSYGWLIFFKCNLKFLLHAAFSFIPTISRHLHIEIFLYCFPLLKFFLGSQKWSAPFWVILLFMKYFKSINFFLTEKNFLGN